MGHRMQATRDRGQNREEDEADPTLPSRHASSEHAPGLGARTTSILPTPLYCPYPYQGSESRSVVSDSLRPHGLYSPGQNTGVGILSLLQGIFPTQGSNPGLPHCRWILYQLSHKGTSASLMSTIRPFITKPRFR